MYTFRGKQGIQGVNGANGTNGTNGITPKVTGTSASVVSISVGAKTFETQAGISWVVGNRLRAYGVTNGAIVEGLITAYSGTTLSVTVDYVSGAGSDSNWNIGLAGQVGATGATGSPPPTIKCTAASQLINAPKLLGFDLAITNTTGVDSDITYTGMAVITGTNVTDVLATITPYNGATALTSMVVKSTLKTGDFINTIPLVGFTKLTAGSSLTFSCALSAYSGTNYIQGIMLTSGNL